MLFAVEFTTEAIAIISALLISLAGTIAYLFRLLLAAKDAQVEAMKVKHDNVKELATEAIRNLELAAAKHLRSMGQPVPPAVAPVTPDHNSPITSKQRDNAERETLKARLTAATLQLDLPAREVKESNAGTTNEEIMNKLDDMDKDVQAVVIVQPPGLNVPVKIEEKPDADKKNGD